MKQKVSEIDDELTYLTFISRVKSKRLSKGISQEDMAVALGINRVTYNNIETGKFKRGITLEDAYRIGRILKIRVFENG